MKIRITMAPYEYELSELAAEVHGLSDGDVVDLDEVASDWWIEVESNAEFEGVVEGD